MNRIGVLKKEERGGRERERERDGIKVRERRKKRRRRLGAFCSVVAHPNGNSPVACCRMRIEEMSLASSGNARRRDELPSAGSSSSRIRGGGVERRRHASFLNSNYLFRRLRLGLVPEALDALGRRASVASALIVRGRVSRRSVPGHGFEVLVFFSLFGFSFSSLRKKGRGGRESENDVENLNLVLSLFFCSCFGIDQPRRGEQPHTNHAGSPGTRHPHSRRVSNTEGRWPGALVERKSEGAVVLAPVPLARLLSEEMRGKTKTMSTQGFCPKAPFRLPSAPSLRQGDIVFLSAQLGRGQGAV